MAVTFDMEASKRFLEALENLRRPQGEGLRSDIRGEVPQALADEFRALMEESGPARAEGLQNAADPGRVGMADAPEGVRAVENARPADEAARIDGVRDDSDADAGGFAASGPQRLMTPENLLSLQFDMNMHMFEFKSFDAIRQSALREMESMLRQTN